MSTVRAVWDAYQTLLRHRRRAAATIDLYQVVLHDLWTHLERNTGKEIPVQWHEITPEAVDQWLGRPGKHSGFELSPSTQNTYGRVVKRFYVRATARGWLQGPNPLEDWEPPPPPGPRPRALPVEAVGRLLLLVDPRIRMMVLIGYHQALRVGETVRLRVEDVALGVDPPMLLVHGKGGRRVWMPLSPALIPSLRAYMATRPSKGPLIPNFRDPARHLDPTYAAHLLAVAMRPVVGDSGHALRHTAAQQLRRLTHDPFVVKDALRHASLEQQGAYVGQDPELLADALGKLPDPLEAK